MKRFCYTLLSLIMLVGCSNNAFVDREAGRRIDSDYSARAGILSAAGICLDTMDVDRNTLTALKFLYAYMPLGDMLNYSPEFYRECVECTEKAVAEMPWGSGIPARELRHFVLPPRVNNENLDGCRPAFYAELAPRIKGMSMYDAVLEVNHWCHEKVTYRPSDSRTSSPLSTVRTSWGRCGEESTLLVAALRSVAIPARQIYTPRWAHTDDNHAWVEAWVGGKWHFLGACEPEPVLDLGWFNAPASRAMLMNTNVFGYYDGPEEKLSVTPLTTTINVVANYAPDPCRLNVRILDRDGSPVPGAKVEYKIYNYAEFYSIATLEADSNGLSGITLGDGDLLVYASDGKGNFGCVKTHARRDDVLELTLKYNADSDFGQINSMPAFSVVPPVEKPSIPQVDDSLRAECSRRFSREDSLRNAYCATFIKAEDARRFADGIGLDPGRTSTYLVMSHGNCQEIKKFLSDASASGRGATALRMLGLLSEKDLRDTPAGILSDHLQGVADDAPDMVLSPRIANEMIRPWRCALAAAVPRKMAERISTDPSSLVRWCCDSLTAVPKAGSPYIAPGPLQVWNSRLCDPMSRDIFFVAMCRTFGVEAWKDSVTGTVRYRLGGNVYDVDFEASSYEEPASGTLVLEYEPSESLTDPKYYTHFTLSRFNGRGFELLEYSENATFARDFRGGIQLRPGLYLLTTGIRMASGEVSSVLRLFRIVNGTTAEEELIMSDDSHKVRVIGSFDSETAYISMPDGELKSLLSTTGRGYFTTIVLDAKSEPSVHVLKDLEAAADGLDAWGRPIMLIFASKEAYDSFDAGNYRLPACVKQGVDADGRISHGIASEMKLGDAVRLPLVLVSDTFNRVVFFSSGYSIGTGDRLVDLAAKLK